MWIRKNDGYALPFVLIVMVIICLVGVSIMSSSLNNLQNQQASIERMQAQYEAAGKIEKTIAYVKGNNSISVDTLKVGGTELVNEEIIPSLGEGGQNKLSFVLEATDSQETVKIRCEMEIVGSFSIPSDVYATAEADYKYISYEIIDLPEIAEGVGPDA